MGKTRKDIMNMVGSNTIMSAFTAVGGNKNIGPTYLIKPEIKVESRSSLTRKKS